MDEQPSASPSASDPVSEDVKPPVSEPSVEEDAPAAPTSPYSQGIPYDRYHAVQQELKETKEKLKALEVSSAPSEPQVDDEEEPSDEDEPELKKRLRKLEDEAAWTKLTNQFPVLSERRTEFDEYREAEHPRMGVDQAAKLFLVDKGLAGEAAPPRKGMEKPTAGPKTGPEPRWTLEAIDDLEKKDPLRHRKLLEQGAFDEALKGWQVK